MVAKTTQNRFSFDFKVFSILLLLAAIPILLGSWLIFRSYESAYLDIVGASLSESAGMAYQALDSYIQRQIMAVAALTEIPTLQEAVRQGYTDMEKDLEQIRKAIPAAEGIWPGLDPQAAAARKVLDNAASRFLRNYIAVEKAYRDIWVTDFLGRLVAATSKPSSFYYAGKDWWKETFGDGRRGSVYIADIRSDSQNKSAQWAIAHPFTEPGGGVIGVIYVIVDAQEIFGLIESYRAGPLATAALLRPQGEVLSAPGYSIRERRIYPGAQEILSAREKGRSYIRTTGEKQSLSAWSSRTFKESYPHLDWIVVTNGSVKEMLAPLSLHRSYFMTLLALILLFSIVATLVLSRLESMPMIEQDPHLETL
jgi:hypothetical protein